MVDAAAPQVTRDFIGGRGENARRIGERSGSPTRRGAPLVSRDLIGGTRRARKSNWRAQWGWGALRMVDAAAPQVTRDFIGGRGENARRIGERSGSPTRRGAPLVSRDLIGGTRRARKSNWRALRVPDATRCTAGIARLHRRHAESAQVELEGAVGVASAEDGWRETAASQAPRDLVAGTRRERKSNRLARYGCGAGEARFHRWLRREPKVEPEGAG